MNSIKLLCVLLTVLESVNSSVSQDLKFAFGEQLEEEESQKSIQQEWRAVDYYSPPVNQWPSEEGEVTPMPKRRRLRKRKKRPDLVQSVEDKALPEPWEAVAQEENQKSYRRRRILPAYEASTEDIRDPLTALAEADERQKKTDLRSVLKQAGGQLSLSEILQRKNLSLSELLTGNKQAIAALTENSRRSYQKNEDDATSTEVIDPSPKRSTTTKPLPVTMAKMLQKLPLRPVTISVAEVFGFSTTTSGPLKMMIDLEMETSTETEDPTTVPPKMWNITAEDELMELLRNPSDRERLSRILRLRNMTVEELVAQRERGSSQVHLADIFHNDTREPEPVLEVHGTLLIPTAKPIPKPNSVRKPKSQNITMTKPDDYTITSFPTFKIEHKTPEVPPSPTTTTELTDISKIQDVDNDISGLSDWQKKQQEDYSDDYEESFFKFPTGVKSAILASFAIIALSLVVFVTILVIFKWTQKHKQRLSYNGSMLGTKILESEQGRRSFKAFVCETLGRRKNYYKSHAPSMSDTIWNDTKKSYMI